ncbi:MAG: BamA/TamA family outer membrane protein, partial [Bacteroidota bacterium]
FEGNHGYDINTDMFMRDVSLSENLRGLEHLNGYMAYRGGQTFYWFIAEKYGKEKIGEFINRLRIMGSANLAFKNTFGMSFEDFSELWVKEMKKYYFPDIARFKAPEDYAVRITNHAKDDNFYNSSPAISPNGEKVAYIADKAGTFRVFIRSIENKEDNEELVGSLREQDFEELNLLTPGISWNPKGTQLAISAKAGGEDAIFIVEVKNGNYDKLKFGIKSISSVNWSPDGKYLLFVGVADERSDLFLYEFATKKLSKLTDDVFFDSHPVWTSDSKKIYFVSDRKDVLSSDIKQKQLKIWNTDYDASDIYSIDLTTKIVKQITFDPQYHKTSLVVSNDEKKILYVSDKNGIGNLYELNLATGTSRPKTNSLNAVTQISLSKDESKLLFTTQVNGGYDIFMMRFPFDKNLDIDSLPNTSYRDKENLKKQLIASIKKEKENSAKDSTENKLVGYGGYNVEFSRQTVVKPNPDAEKRINQDLLQDVNAAVVPDSGYPVHDYKIKFSPDLVLGNPGYSTYWGFQGIAQMLFSDVLGDHLIYVQANLLMDLRNSTFLAAYSYLPGIIDYTVTGYHSAAIVYDQYGYLNRYRKYGGSLQASYPFDLFNRTEFSISMLNASKENIDLPASPDYVSHFLIMPEARYVHDNALWGYFGPQRGSRYSLDIKASPKFGGSGVGFVNLSADIRQYIPLFDYYSIALRVSGGKSFGPDPRKYYMGGIENWINSRFKNGTIPFDDPVDFVIMEFPMPMRGWAVAEKTGTQYFLTNAEFRFPMFTALLAGPIPMLIQGVMGNIFLDMGGAWNGSVQSFKSTRIEDGLVKPNDLLMSAGVGIRAYVLGLPLKVDVAWRNEFYNWSEPYWEFSLGFDW